MKKNTIEKTMGLLSGVLIAGGFFLLMGVAGSVDCGALTLKDMIIPALGALVMVVVGAAIMGGCEDNEYQG